MNHYLIFFFGMVVGGFVGVLALSLCRIARDSDENRPWPPGDGKEKEDE